MHSSARQSDAAAQGRRNLHILVALGIAGWLLAWTQMSLLVALSQTLIAGQGGSPRPFTSLLVGFLGAAAAGIWLVRARQAAESRASVANLALVERKVVGSLLQQPDSFFDRNPVQLLISGLGRNLVSAADGDMERIRCILAVGDVAVVLLFFLARGIPGAGWVAAGIGACACLGGFLSYRRTKAAADHADRCADRQDEISSSLAEFLEARSEIRSSASWDYVAMRMDHKGRQRADAYLDFSEARTGVDLILQGGQLLTLAVFFAVGMSSADGIAVLLPVLLREIPKVFERSGRVVDLLGRVEESSRAQKRLQAWLTAPNQDEKNTPTPLRPGADLRVENLTRVHRLSDGREAGGIRQAALHVPGGTFAVVTGAAGSGKSTLLRTIAGMAKPDSGRVLLGDLDLAEATPLQRASTVSFLPQTPRLIAGSLADNLVFASCAWRGNDEEMPLIEATGMGALLRSKALLLEPGPESWARWRELTRHLAPLKPATDNDLNFYRPLIEAEQDERESARAVRAAAARLRKDQRFQNEVFALENLGQEVFSSQKSLLLLPDYETFSRLSPVSLSHAQWMCKRCLVTTEGERLALAYALASTPEEIKHALGLATHEVRARLAMLSTAVRAAAVRRTDSSPPSWRAAVGNFAGTAEPTAWTGQSAAIASFLALEGLSHKVGTGGSGLSGGQMQLVALTRVLRRRTPLVILDEPTSAMDETAKERIGRCLAANAGNRIILAITHDQTLVGAASCLIEIADGRVVRTALAADKRKSEGPT